MPPARTILVAEDEENDFFLLNRAFSKTTDSVSLVRVADGVEAIEYLQGENGFGDRQRFPLPHLVILDLKMPRRDGFEVLEWMRNDPVFRAVIVIVMSSSKQDRDVNRAYALGANSYMSKPNDISEFVELSRAVTNFWFTWAQCPQLSVPVGRGV